MMPACFRGSALGHQPIDSQMNRIDRHTIMCTVLIATLAIVRVGGDIVSDSSLAKLVATFVILIGLAFWLKAERNKLLGCHIDCATEFSASSMGER
jgi:hypothetical protein